MDKFNHILYADGDPVFEGLARSAVVYLNFTVYLAFGIDKLVFVEKLFYILLGRAVEYGSRNLPAELLARVREAQELDAKLPEEEFDLSAEEDGGEDIDLEPISIFDNDEDDFAGKELFAGGEDDDDDDFGDSGLVTSPLESSLIFSGEATLILIELKSFNSNIF